jgi:hypothetical protein
MRFLRWLGLAIVAAAVALAALFGIARVLDGPIGPIPGGPLRGAVSSEDPGDWSFAGDAPTLELEVAGVSRTVWFVTHGGALYIAAAEAARKRWPAQAMADGGVKLRVGGRLYERRAERIVDPALGRAVGDVFRAKYEVDITEEQASRVWLFRIDPRTPGG